MILKKTDEGTEQTWDLSKVLILWRRVVSRCSDSAGACRPSVGWVDASQYKTRRFYWEDRN